MKCWLFKINNNWLYLLQRGCSRPSTTLFFKFCQNIKLNPMIGSCWSKVKFTPKNPYSPSKYGEFSQNTSTQNVNVQLHWDLRKFPKTLPSLHVLTAFWTQTDESQFSNFTVVMKHHSLFLGGRRVYHHLFRSIELWVAAEQVTDSRVRVEDNTCIIHGYEEVIWRSVVTAEMRYWCVHLINQINLSFNSNMPRGGWTVYILGVIRFFLAQALLRLRTVQCQCELHGHKVFLSNGTVMRRTHAHTYIWNSHLKSHLLPVGMQTQETCCFQSQGAATVKFAHSHAFFVRLSFHVEAKAHPGAIFLPASLTQWGHTIQNLKNAENG